MPMVPTLESVRLRPPPDLGIRTHWVLKEVSELVTPGWPLKERSAWFAGAAIRSDNNFDVSTLRGDIQVMVVTSQLSDPPVRIISVTPNRDE